MIALTIICMLLAVASPQTTDFDVTQWTNDTNTSYTVVDGSTTTTTTISTTTLNSASSSHTPVSATSGGSIQQQLINIDFLIIGIFFLLLKYIN